ncbi:hypothetical protein TNCV_3897291 [Trichonephila clavipes]|nr:hypothetical protein TNCV_3897291 [Trichonephila clavipes]
MAWTQVLKSNFGLAITFVLKCYVCSYRVEFPSYFHEVTPNARINARFEFNRRSVGRGAEDWTWQKQGYTSLNGAVTVTSIDTGKVIDAEILLK